LLEQITYLNSLLADSKKIYALIKQDLLDIKAKFVTSSKRDDSRRTQIVPMEGEVNIEDLIADEPCVITLSHRGYVKRVPLTVYREQKRGGRGITGAAIKEEDFITTVFVADTHDTLLFFTNTGRVFAERAFDVPEAPRTSFGKPIVNLLQFQENEMVAALLPIRAFAEDVDIMFATQQGTVKKTALADYKNVNKNGIRALNIDEGDKLIQVRLTHVGDDVLLITANGQAMRFNEAQVRRMGRTATGVRGIRLAAGDVVRSFDVVDNSATLLVATENGYGKRTEFNGFTPHHRGGKGMIAIKDESGRNGKVVAAHAVKEDQSVIIITSSGMMVRSPVSDIRVCGRSAQGVRLVRMDEGTVLVSASIADAEEVEVPANIVPALASDDNDNTDTESPTIAEEAME